MAEDQVGYVIWGVLAIVVLIPELLAAFGREIIPWPGVARTATNLLLPVAFARVRHMT